MSTDEVTLMDGEIVTVAEAQKRSSEIGHAVLSVDGKEYGDPTPVAPPVGFTEGPSLMDQVRAMVRRELVLQDELEVDTPDEEEDFDHPEAFEPFTRHEVDGLSREEILDEAVRRGMIREKAAPDGPGVTQAPSPAAPSSAAPPPTVPPKPDGTST